MIMMDQVRSRGAERLCSVLTRSRFFKATCWGLLLVVVCFGGIRVVPGEAEERGSISGVVLLNGEGIAEHRIMLIRFNSAGEVQRTPGQTNAAGQFTFDNLETGEEFEYFVGIRYAEQLYKSEPIRLAEAQQRTGILVQVVPPRAPTATETAESPPVQIVHHLVLFGLREHYIEVKEVVRVLRNKVGSLTGSDTLPGAWQSSLYLPLPNGYYNFAGIQGLIPEQVRLQPSGFYYAAPSESGEHRVAYTYALPLQTDVVTILTERSLPTAILDIFVADEGLVAVSDMQFIGRVPIESHTFWHFRGVNLGTHTRSWLQVTRRKAAAPFLEVGAYVIVVSLILFGMGLPLYEVWCQRYRQVANSADTSGQMNDLNMARIHLLQAIAQLDDKYQAGSLATNTYEQRRSEYKKQLLHLVQQLRHIPSDKEGTGDLL
jgi:hypothetical protein